MKVMKRTIAPTALVIVFATVLVLSIIPGAQADDDKECSNATLKGSFGYTSTGTILPAFFGLPDTYDPFAPPAGPFAEVGRQTFDGNGDTEYTATISNNGAPTPDLAFKGTYSVNKDCTGSMTLSTTPRDPFTATIHIYFVIDAEGSEIRALVTDQHLVESRVYKKQFRGKEH